MWIFTQCGFFSVVAKQSDPDQVKVRARVKEDLESFVNAYLPNTVIIETPYRDYPYRIFMDKNTWAEIAQAICKEIDYTNFKGQVSKVQGYDRSKLYGKVWSVMNNAEQELEKAHDRSQRRRQPRLEF